MKLTWHTERRIINSLVPYEFNPRQMSEKQVEELKKSLERFDLVEIPAVDTDNTIIAGHQRLKIMQMLGRGGEEIDVRVPSRKLTEAEFKEYNLRSNKNVGDFDFDILANNFDEEMLKDVGFDEIDLGKMGLNALEEDEFDAEAEYANIVEPTAKLGDVYKLGRHTLMCGSSTSPEDFEKLMGGVQARLIFTDPPYSVDYHSTAGLSYDSKKYGGTGGKIFNDDKSPEEALRFYEDILLNLHKHSTNDVTIYWWMANDMNYINRQAWINTGWKQSQIIIWLKNGMIFSPGQIYHRCYEPCMVGWKEKGKHYHNKKLATYRDVFNLDKTDFEEILDVWFEKRDKVTEYVHPTQKPVRLAERALRKNSEPGDVVVDAFGGSGSTLMACEQMNRVCHMMELDPKYVDVIIKRWETYTGLKAEKL